MNIDTAARGSGGATTQPVAVSAARSRATARAAGATDVELADMLRSSLCELARHHAPYVRVFERRAGARLAGLIHTGHVEAASRTGRANMRLTYVHTQAAIAVPPGLDTNELMDQITGRPNPRLEHAATSMKEDH